MTTPTTPAAAVSLRFDCEHGSIAYTSSGSPLGERELSMPMKRDSIAKVCVEMLKAIDAATARESALTQQHALQILSLEAQADERESALVAERDALRAQVPQWLPIDSAPKDGTAIFAKLPDSDIPHSVRFSNERWRIVWDHGPLGWLDAPTHWMPIPALAAPAVEG